MIFIGENDIYWREACLVSSATTVGSSMCDCRPFMDTRSFRCLDVFAYNITSLWILVRAKKLNSMQKSVVFFQELLGGWTTWPLYWVLLLRAAWLWWCEVWYGMVWIWGSFPTWETPHHLGALNRAFHGLSTNRFVWEMAQESRIVSCPLIWTEKHCRVAEQ